MTRPLGLYLHVPFCAGKCPYCDFYSLAAGPEAMDAYTSRLEALLAQYGAACARPLRTVYFGGGTPSLLGEKRLARLLEGAARHFSLEPGAEITCEANPTWVDRPFFAALRRAGFNRISLGVQSASDEHLKALGRPHTFAQAEEAVAAARKAKIKNLSLDLIYGLPGQTLESWRETLERAASLAPALSALTMTLPPGGTSSAKRRKEFWMSCRSLKKSR